MPLERLDRIVITQMVVHSQNIFANHLKELKRKEMETHGPFSFLVSSTSMTLPLRSMSLDGRHNGAVWCRSSPLYWIVHCGVRNSRKRSHVLERGMALSSELWCADPFLHRFRTAGRQASGLDSSNVADASFFNLRSVFQCLESSLQEGLAVTHVKGHSSDPWNDLVDILAKQERAKSFYHPRQALDMRIWKKLIATFLDSICQQCRTATLSWGSLWCSGRQQFRSQYKFHCQCVTNLNLRNSVSASPLRMPTPFTQAPMDIVESFNTSEIRWKHSTFCF